MLPFDFKVGDTIVFSDGPATIYRTYDVSVSSFNENVAWNKVTISKIVNGKLLTCDAIVLGSPVGGGLWYFRLLDPALSMEENLSTVQTMYYLQA